MTNNSNIKSIIKNNISEPAFLLDSELRIIELNNQGLFFLSGAKIGDNIINKFAPKTKEELEIIIVEVANVEQPVSKTASIFLKEQVDELGEYVVAISPLIIDKNDYYLITFTANETNSKTKNTQKNKIKIVTTEIESILVKENLTEILDEIHSSFPFSLIEKSKFQSKINELSNSFWIKESSGKFIITNHEFASSVGLKTNQIEGRFEKDLLPPHLQALYQSLNNYIKETSNTILFEGVKYFDDDKSRKTEIVEFPISDIDNTVVAIVGFTFKVGDEEVSLNKDASLATEAISADNEARVIIDSKNNIIAASVGVNKILGLNVTLKLAGKNLSSFLGADFEDQLKYQKNTIADKNFDFIYRVIFDGENQKDLKVNVQELNDVNDNVSGFALKFSNIDDTISKTTAKGKMFDLIMKNSPEAIFIYEVENLKFLEVNDAALKLYGYKRDQFLTMDLTDLYAPEDIQTLLESSSGKVADNVFTGPWRHKRKDGQSIFVELSKSSSEIYGKNAHLNIVRDVSEQIDNKKQMQVFKTTFENSSDIILITDSDGFITFSNDKSESQLGFLASELEKRPFLSLLSDSDRAKINMNIFQSKDKVNQTLDIKVKNIGGDILSAELTASPILDFENKIESFVLVLKLKQEDQSDRYVNSAPAELSPGHQLDSAFLSNLFHELLTPMNVIVGFVQELIDSIENPSAEQIESNEIIRENQKILLQTMDTAVEYSQIENNKIELKSDDIVFIELLDSLESGVKRTSENSQVEFTYSKVSSSLRFTTDKQRFMSLINLLIVFSIKMTDKKNIFLSAYTFDDESFVVSVKDDRGGISDQLLKNLRELFTVDESVLRHNFGISRFTIRLARKLAEILALRNEIIQKNDKPNEFAIIFPNTLNIKTSLDKDQKNEEEELIIPSGIEEIGLKTDEFEIQKDTKEVETVKEPIFKPIEIVNELDPKPEAKSKPEPISEPAAVETREIDYSQLSCLYVEDQIDSQILFKVQMKDLKLIDFSTSFEDAAPLLKSKSYNFIVMDINLQGEYNGLDALKLIRKMPAYQDIPIIAASAYVLPGDKEKFIEAGFNDFISKPVLQDKLYDSLQKVFS